MKTITKTEIKRNLDIVNWEAQHRYDLGKTMDMRTKKYKEALQQLNTEIDTARAELKPFYDKMYEIDPEFEMDGHTVYNLALQYFGD